MPTKPNKLAIYISGPELALLQRFDYPCSKTVLASAKTTDEGIRLTGTPQDFESLARWVAGDANDAQRNGPPDRADLLFHIAEQLESALGMLL